MELITKIYEVANATMEVPASYGGFHLACVATVIVLTALAILTLKNCSDRAMRVVTAAVWITILLLEIYKQIVFSVYLDEGGLSWDYSWYIFPFQFCSSPLYILPIIAFSHNEKLRGRCIAYMATFSLFAGLAVLCYPGDVFIETVGINYQTMVHHGSQVLMGILYAVRYRDRLNARFFLGGVGIFVPMVLIAMLLNVGAHYAFPIFGIDETFNMFYISPYTACTLPLLSTVYEMVPYPVFVCVYFFGFILCALIVFGVLRLCTKGLRSATMTRRNMRLAYERDCIFYYNM